MLRASLLVLAAAASAVGLYAAMRTDAPRNLASPASRDAARVTLPASVGLAPPRLDTATRFEHGPAPPPATGAAARVTPVRIAPALRPANDAAAQRGAITAVRRERLFNPTITSAASIKAGDREIRLAGVKAPGADARCGEGAGAWPCGTMARAALRRLVRGRAIECVVPPGAAAIPDPADCSVGGADLGGWLVAHGWAAGDGVRFAKDEARARALRAGLWGDGRPDRAAPPGGPFAFQPTTVAAGIAAAVSPPESAAPMSLRLSGTP